MRWLRGLTHTSRWPDDVQAGCFLLSTYARPVASLNCAHHDISCGWGTQRRRRAHPTCFSDVVCASHSRYTCNSSSPLAIPFAHRGTEYRHLYTRSGRHHWTRRCVAGLCSHRIHRAQLVLPFDKVAKKKSTQRRPQKTDGEVALRSERFYNCFGT